MPWSYVLAFLTGYAICAVIAHYTQQAAIRAAIDGVMKAWEAGLQAALAQPTEEVRAQFNETMERLDSAEETMTEVINLTERMRAR